MFFTEFKSDEILGPHIDHVRCHKCHETHYHLRGKVRYLAVELVNLPLFIVNRQYEFRCECGHCEAPFVKPKLFKELKRQMLPWTYLLSKHIGVFVLALFAWMFWQAQVDESQRTQALFDAPQVNDFFFMDYYAFNPDNPEAHPKYRYTTLKTLAVDDDSVTLQLGNIFKSRAVAPREHVMADRVMLPGFFSPEKIELSRTEFRQLYERGIFYDGARPKNLFIEGWIVLPQSKPKVWEYQYNQDNQEGISLFRGENGYARDYVAAFESFTKAAEADDPAGQTNLAEMYRDGLGTTEDKQKALYWFSSAAAQGWEPAKAQYEALCQSMDSCVKN